MRKLRARGGFTLIEALVAMSMFIVVLLAVLVTADFSSRASNNEASRSEALSDETTGVARIALELRRTYQVLAPLNNSESSYMDVLVRLPVNGAKRIFINCEYKEPSSGTYKGAYNECVRYESAPTGYTAGTAPSGVTPEVIVPRVLNQTTADTSDKVFKNLTTPSGGSEPAYGEISVDSPGNGGLSTSVYKHQFTVRDSFFLHDLDYGQ